MTRIILMEVPDTETEDNLHIAIATWNYNNPDRKIDVLQQTNMIVNRPR